MHSIKNIYEKIYDFENLHKAWEKARRGKRYREDVLSFNRNYEEHLIEIQNQLIYETYEVGRYHSFYVFEPKKAVDYVLAVQRQDSTMGDISAAFPAL